MSTLLAGRELPCGDQAPRGNEAPCGKEGPCGNEAPYDAYGLAEAVTRCGPLPSS